jgi:type IV pilus assembly protein PilB
MAKDKETDYTEVAPQDWLQVTITKAVSMGASDIHIEPEQFRLNVRFRIDGILRVIDQLHLTYLNQVISCLKVMSGLNIAESRRPQDGHIVFRPQTLAPTESVDIRLSIFPTVFGEAAVLRIQNRKDLIFDKLDKLGIEPYDLEKLQFVLRQSEGMVLVTGPGGSGKTTTLYTILNALASSQRNIVTLEDPVELRLNGVRQSQIHPELGFDFSQGLRSILRQDANVVMVGEIRDDETAEISIRAALTGILFLASIHTTNSVGAIIRFIELGIPPSMVAAALRVVITQRLIRNVCANCREKITPSDKIVQFCRIPKDYQSKFVQGKGCSECDGTGYKGRTGIFEVMFVNEDLQRMIIEGAAFTDLELQAKRNGMRTLKDVAISLALNGATSLDEVIRMTPLH